ncbi:sirohydrochlorin cobaltochelatase [uncultured Prevotella sp.]|uniref:sirohydrochlorin cobaltochelatase n=2 Tax=uncultured Prevotella sp. TaxID=159272 RepID=UPI00262A221F|nr:sirohydrochlorin cobaltochelatase [uncultured Prevotella sp.]
MKQRNILTIVFTLFCVATIMAQNVDNEKTGILLVHYGTSNDKSRAQTIDKLNSRVAETFPDCAVVEAYSAPSVIKTLAKRGIKKLYISQALDSLKALGCNKLVVQSTMLLDGVMTEMLRTEVGKVKNDFREVSVVRPLLYSVDDCRTMIEMLTKSLLADKSVATKKSQVVLVGHGSDSPANAMYSQIDYLLKAEGKSSWHVGTIEGFPKIENVEQQLKNSKNKNVILVPLLYIAGNHQKEDIDGVWKTQLQTKGYHVDVFGKGIGEMTEIQNMIIGKIDAQIKTVNSEKAK